jgi:hypothetical protein
VIVALLNTVPAGTVGSEVSSSNYEGFQTQHCYDVLTEGELLFFGSWDDPEAKHCQCRLIIGSVSTQRICRIDPAKARWGEAIYLEGKGHHSKS